MEIVIAIGEWFTATINGLLGWIGIPVTIYTQLVVLIATGLLVLLLVNESLVIIEYRRRRKAQEELDAIPAKMTISEKDANAPISSDF
jgi:hypothetical protein